jgi:hypothetical protein
MRSDMFLRFPSGTLPFSCPQNASNAVHYTETLALSNLSMSLDRSVSSCCRLSSHASRSISCRMASLTMRCNSLGSIASNSQHSSPNCATYAGVLESACFVGFGRSLYFLTWSIVRAIRLTLMLRPSFGCHLDHGLGNLESRLVCPRSIIYHR